MCGVLGLIHASGNPIPSVFFFFKKNLLDETDRALVDVVVPW